jgi:hypothetical protein
LRTGVPDIQITTEVLLPTIKKTDQPRFAAVAGGMVVLDIIHLLLASLVCGGTITTCIWMVVTAGRHSWGCQCAIGFLGILGSRGIFGSAGDLWASFCNQIGFF